MEQANPTTGVALKELGSQNFSVYSNANQTKANDFLFMTAEHPTNGLTATELHFHIFTAPVPIEIIEVSDKHSTYTGTGGDPGYFSVDKVTSGNTSGTCVMTATQALNNGTDVLRRTKGNTDSATRTLNPGEALLWRLSSGTTTELKGMHITILARILSFNLKP
jgi:hypothetical protein